MRSFLGAVVAAGCAFLQLACAVSPAVVAVASAPRLPPCIELPAGLDDLTGPLPMTICAVHLEPPELDRAARARAIEVIAALGPDDPHSFVLANQVLDDELAAANWEGFDTPEILARMREMIILLEPIVDAKVHGDNRNALMALACAHALIGEPEQATARLNELHHDRPGPWLPYVYLIAAELVDDQERAIQLYENATTFDALPTRNYVRYRLAYALRYPQVVDQARAIELLEAIVAEPDGPPRLDLAVRRRAALELRALGHEVEVPECAR